MISIKGTTIPYSKRIQSFASFFDFACLKKVGKSITAAILAPITKERPETHEIGREVIGGITPPAEKAA